jgi:hypothetical protein
MKLFVLTATLFLFAKPALSAEKPYPKPSHGGSATYVVPVSEDLKPFATFPISDIQTKELNGELNGHIQIRYTLPVQLTGAKNDVVFVSTNKATNGTYTNFKGPNGEANCNESVCNLRFSNLKLDQAVVRQNFIDQGITGLELSQRMDVFAKFSGDPAGLVHFN